MSSKTKSYASLRLPAYDSTDAPSPELNRLLREWDARLEADGFTDLEHRNVNGTLSHHLPKSAADFAYKYNASHEEYYYLAGMWLTDRGWNCEDQELAWMLHADGVGRGDLAKLIGWNTHRTKRFLDREVERMLAYYSMTRDGVHQGGRARSTPAADTVDSERSY